ncbi:MAG: heme-dependent oxidative N-demethylase subunit alpha family protein, partial [Myxococcota bacterium]
MRARLTRFPVELGNGAVDRQYFQPDDQLERYRQAKRAPSRPGRPRPCDRWTMHDDTEARRAALDAVRDWIVATLDREAPTLGRDLPGPRREFWDALGQTVQCDLVVMHRTAASDAAILMHVSFPSRWRPEAVSGTSFRTIHGPVPGFSEQPAQARSMVATMIERGPYLRFAWSLVADERLDHHPDDSEYTPWTADTPGWLRV